MFRHIRKNNRKNTEPRMSSGLTCILQKKNGKSNTARNFLAFIKRKPFTGQTDVQQK